MERDEHIYAYVMDELNNDVKDESLWIKAYAMADGSEEKIKPKYIQYKVQIIKDLLQDADVDYKKLSKESLDEYLENSSDLCKTDRDHDRAFDWMNNLWKWADENNIKPELIPRTKEQLLETTFLNFYSEQLTKLPKEICKLTNLTRLLVEGGTLQHIPKELVNLGNLKILAVSKTELIQLPEEIGDLISLTKLSISFNKQFENITPSIGRLVNLTELNFGANRLAVLPKEIGELKNLTTLGLSVNKFVNLPEELGKLTGLTWLGLGMNELISLPDNIINLVNLTGLELYHNKNLILTLKQVAWIQKLIDQGCKVHLDDDVLKNNNIHIKSDESDDFDYEYFEMNTSHY